MPRTTLAAIAATLFWTLCASGSCHAQSSWRLYDPKTALVPIEDLITGVSYRMASDSMRMEFKMEAIARAKHETEQGESLKRANVLLSSYMQVIDRQEVEGENKDKRIESLEEDVSDLRPWVIIGKSVVVVGSIALVGWTTVTILQATH